MVAREGSDIFTVRTMAKTFLCSAVTDRKWLKEKDKIEWSLCHDIEVAQEAHF